MQRSQFIHDVAPENASHTDILLHLDLPVNRDASKLKQFGEQTVQGMKECFNRLNPRSEIVTTDECTELVNIHARSLQSYIFALNLNKYESKHFR